MSDSGSFTSTEARELELVSKVEFAILKVATDEDKLQPLLNKYLAPLLLKAASDYASVRVRVIQFAHKLRTFVESPKIVLPVDSLLDQLIKAESAVLKQLDVVFIRHSLPRLTPQQREALLPTLLISMAREKDVKFASVLFNFLLRILPDIKLPSRDTPDDKALRERFAIQESDAQVISRWLGLVLLLRMPPRDQVSQEKVKVLNSMQLSDLEFLQPWNPDMEQPYHNISQTKTRAMSLLGSGIFTDQEKFLPALYASSNMDSNVSSIGSDVIKKLNINMEDEQMVKTLWKTHLEMDAPYRVRILNILTRSDISTTMTECIVNAVERDMGIRAGQEQELQKMSNLEKTKLHKALFDYIKFAAVVGPSKGEFFIGPKIIGMLKNYICDMGWPRASMTLGPDISLRSFAYEIIGILGKASRFTFQDKFSLADWLFQSLSEESAVETVVDVEGALSMLSTCFKPDEDTSVAEKQLFVDMLLRYMELPLEEPIQRSVRHVAVKWANRCLPFWSVQARWIDIIALASKEDDGNEVREEGAKGLDPWMAFTYSDKEPSVDELPDWKEMTTYFFEQRGRLSTDGDTDMSGMKADSHENFGGAKIQAYPRAIEACMQMMMLRGIGSGIKIDLGWSQNLKSLLQTDIKTRETIKTYLSLPENSAPICALLSHALSGALSDASEAVVEACLSHTIQIASISPFETIAAIIPNFELTNMRKLLLSPRKEIRFLAAEMYGIMTAHPCISATDIDAEMTYILSLFASNTKTTAAGAAQNLVALEGGLLAYGHLLSRMVFYGRDIPEPLPYSPTSLLVKDSGPKVTDSTLDAVLESLMNLWAAKLCIPGATGEGSVASVIDILTTHAKKGNEKAITCLGRLALALDYNDAEVVDNEALVPKILEELFKLHEFKRIEVHFAIGEAIVALVFGWEADSIKLLLNVDSPSTVYMTQKRPHLLSMVLDRLIQNTKATKPSLLKASGVWLFSIVQYCSHVVEVHQRLREAQASFMRLLSARDDMVQETASRGLTLVYEKGDEALRDKLTEDLVTAFTGNNTRMKVDQETELFEAGALPTGDGQSVTSYKDIVNLASEVGDQTLIYKFMSLASNAAMWSTRSAFGRFGLSNILSDTEVDPKLYPKLYRYRFDPNPNVQRSMNDIWKAMVKEPAATLDQHFDLIMNDLLKSIVGKEWRVREASCSAISDLIQGRNYSQYEKYYSHLWVVSLKVIDDVKGSVRKAALHLCMTLSKTLIRTLENSTENESTKAMMDQALDFLLSDKGTDSSVEDVKVFATVTLLDVCKKGGRNLQLYIPRLVPHLLGLLSTIEPDVVGYAYQRVSHDTKERIDKKRAALANQSPLSEAVDECLRFADGPTIEALYPHLETTIKSAMGMPTKIGCGRVLGTLFTRHAMDIKPMSGKLMILLLKHLFDGNDEVSKSYARAAAYGMRVASSSSRIKFCEKLIGHYFNAEDEKRRQRVSDAILALSKTSADVFTAMESVILPFVFFASHDVDEYSRTVFSSIWGQHAGSSRTVARYVHEVVGLVERALETSKWDMHHTGAFTIGDLVTSLGTVTEATGQFSDANIKLIWPVLDKSLALKSFPGKEKLLESFPEFVKRSKTLWQSDDSVAAHQKKIILREAKRNNIEYKSHAFTALWKFANARTDLDLLDEIAAIVTPSLDEFTSTDTDKMDIDSNDREADAIRANLGANALSALAHGYSATKLSEAPFAVVAAITAHAAPYLTAPDLAPMRRRVWYDAVAEIMDRAAAAAARRPCAQGEFSVAAELLASLDLDTVEVGTEAQRIARVAALSAVVAAWKKEVFGKVQDADRTKLLGIAQAGLERERGLAVRKKWEKVLAELK
ncbi:hypothetical protein BROUX41_006313 [Berkeleyomyces rouxiae]|uniref:uncharacterized protein n=1 Tax=Berkeleyomyces rouxiae TaxID=2035830 RepID=UPI003B7A1EE4